MDSKQLYRNLKASFPTRESVLYQCRKEQCSPFEYLLSYCRDVYNLPKTSFAFNVVEDLVSLYHL